LLNYFFIYIWFGILEISLILFAEHLVITSGLVSKFSVLTLLNFEIVKVTMDVVSENMIMLSAYFMV